MRVLLSCIHIQYFTVTNHHVCLWDHLLRIKQCLVNSCEGQVPGWYHIVSLMSFDLIYIFIYINKENKGMWKKQHVVEFTHTNTHTPSSWELSCHCLPGPWPVERVSYLSFCSARGSHLNTASVVSFSQHDDGERERERETDYKRGFN